MNPTSPNYYQDPRIAEAQAKAKSTQEAYASSAASDITLPDLLKQALNKKFTTDNPLMKDIEGARTDVMNSFTGAQASVLPQSNNGMIFSPTQQADLIQRYRSPSVSRLATLNDLFGLNVGGIQNVIGETSRASQAQTAIKKGAADSAKQDVQDLLDLASAQQAQANTDRQFNENVRQFGLDYALKQQNLAIDLLKAQQTGAKVPANLQKSLTTFNSVQQAINSLVDQAKVIRNRLGDSGLSGKLQSKVAVQNAKLGRDDDLKRYLELRDSFASLLAKGVGGETGVLTNKDIDRALKFTSSENPTKEELDNALRDLRDIQKNAKYNTQTMFKLNGVTWDDSYVVPARGSSVTQAANYQQALDSIFNE